MVSLPSQWKFILVPVRDFFEINALSALVFLFSILLVIGYYFISREKEEQVWKDSIPF